MSDAVDFLYADKHGSLLQIDTKIIWWVWWSSFFGNFASLQCLYNIPKQIRDEVEFFDAEKHQSFLPVDFNTLGIKVFYNVIGMIMKNVKRMVMGMIKHSQSTQSNKFAVSLQYL